MFKSPHLAQDEDSRKHRKFKCRKFYAAIVVNREPIRQRTTRYRNFSAKRLAAAASAKGSDRTLRPPSGTGESSSFADFFATN